MEREREYRLQKKLYGKEEVQTMLSENFHRFCGELEKKGVQILENNVKIQEKTSCYLICGELEVEEPVGTERMIQPDQELKSESESESRSE